MKSNEQAIIVKKALDLTKSLESETEKLNQLKLEKFKPIPCGPAKDIIMKSPYPEIKIKKISIKTDSHGYRLVVTIDVPFGTQLTGKVHKLQQYIIDKIESFTGILIEEVSIIIDKISKPSPKKD